MECRACKNEEHSGILRNLCDFLSSRAEFVRENPHRVISEMASERAHSECCSSLSTKSKDILREKGTP
ncbi:MAG: hypothetical protein AB2L14_13285 [Candidatus Xenobiia bacterium LiM19]